MLLLAHGRRWLNRMAKRTINVEVKPKYPDEPLEKMVRRFIKKVKKQEILDRYREKMYYEKPSTKRRKEAERRKKIKKK